MGVVSCRGRGWESDKRGKLGSLSHVGVTAPKEVGGAFDDVGDGGDDGYLHDWNSGGGGGSGGVDDGGGGSRPRGHLMSRLGWRLLSITLSNKSIVSKTKVMNVSWNSQSYLCCSS